MTEDDLVAAWRTLTGERRDCLVEAVMFCLRAEHITRQIAGFIADAEDDRPTAAETPRAKRLRDLD